MGEKFGTLTTLGMIRVSGRVLWKCECICGGSRNVRKSHLVSGKVDTCGKCSIVRASALFRKPLGASTWNSKYLTYKRSANKRNIPFELAKQELVNICSESCYYCENIPGLVNYSKGAWNDVYSNGIDRVDSNAGYVDGNCVSCCWICNRAKGTMTQRDFYVWVSKIHQKLNQSNKMMIIDSSNINFDSIIFN